MSTLPFTAGKLIEQYRSGATTAERVINSVYDAIESEPLQPVWIELFPRTRALDLARELQNNPRALALPLFGVPFAIKDNIDLEGVPTTAACPDFAYTPQQSATVVTRLISAGAIPVGKTNMDQFATGLVGTRSPYGACSSVFDPRYISGGSSSGSAVAVANGQVMFSLGTDTAGSGRVPAACNGLIGLKPSRGLISAAGIVPACRSLDCVSIFANDAETAKLVWDSAIGFDPKDSYSRSIPTGHDAAPWLAAPRFRFGVPAQQQLEFFGNGAARRAYESALTRLEAIGGERVEIDLEPFLAAARLLYSGPWVAERLSVLEVLLARNPEAVNPVVRKIVSNGSNYNAVDTFRAFYDLEHLRQLTELEWERVDVLVLPTVGTTYTHDQIAADPITLNSNLGYYTNFVNLLDLAAVAVPAGRNDEQPFGISLIGRAFADEALLALASRFVAAAKQRPAVASTSASTVGTAPGCILIAVVGAHLRGQPLNHELTSRGAAFVRSARTAPNYRLYALQGTVPPKPGLVRDDAFSGPGIELELWSVPSDEFGTFVAGVPAPLGIGNATLADGQTVKCFICEPYALADAIEITSFGGWKSYRKAAAQS